MILAVPDLHFKERLSYADYIPDKREGERKEILDFIVETSKKCDSIVFLGDNFDRFSNPPEVIRAFTEFVERFSGKDVFILGGNHEKQPNGKTAVDYLREIKNPKWHIITNEVLNTDGDIKVSFCPYFFRQELEQEDNAAGAKELMKRLPGGDILFHHHAVSDTKTDGGAMADLFDEIILPRKALEKKYKLIVGGHVHKPQKIGQTLVAGSVFANEANEDRKKVWTIDEKTLEVTEHELPGRSIVKINDPTIKQLDKIEKKSIVKVVLTEKRTQKEADELKAYLADRFDAFLFLEQYPNERKKIIIEDDSGDITDYSVEKLLGIYSKAREVSLEKLNKAWKIIKV